MTAGTPPRGENGYVMAALLAAMSVMSILLTVALPVHSTLAKRERELELIFRGEQYVRAIGLYQRKYPQVYPPSVDVLIQQRFLRKRFRDPMTADGEFIILRGGTSRMDLTNKAGQTQSGVRPDAAIIHRGINGVVSASNAESLIAYRGFRRYNQWTFVYIARSQTTGHQIPAP